MGAEVRLTEYGDVLTHDNADGTQTRIVTVFGSEGMEKALRDLNSEEAEQYAPVEASQGLIKEEKRMLAPLRVARLAGAALTGALGSIIDRKDK